MNTSRGTVIFGRIVLLVQGTVLTLISSRILTDPVLAAAKDQIQLTSPLGLVVAQIGFGAFPLATALFVIGCALSRDAVRTGLAAALIVNLTAIAVRLHGVMLFGGAAEHRGPFIGETVFTGLTTLALLITVRGGAEPQVS